MTHRRPFLFGGGSWLFAVVTMILASKCECAEFKWFKLTDIDGALRFGYSSTETQLDLSDGEVVYENRYSNEQELQLNTRSYIFHPNLLEMELGAGLRLENEKVERETGTNQAEGTYTDFYGKWNFLKNKPYPFSLYYTQHNPTQSVGIADTLTIETKNYGMTLFLRQPLISTPISFRFDHLQNKGDSSFTIIDDTTDTVSLDVTGDVSSYGYGRLGISRVSQESASGSRSLPLQASTSQTDSVDWNSSLTFGSERDIYLTNYLLASKNVQSNAADRDQITFYNHLSLDIGESLQAYNTVNYSSTKFDVNDFQNQRISVGLRNRNVDPWSIDSYLESGKEKSKGFDRLSEGLSASVVYSTDINERWNTSVGYSTLYRVNSQTTDLVEISVLDESHLLNGLTPVALNHDSVVPGTVTVDNQAHTQTYVENTDYRLTVVGEETRIERLPTGSIADGETVLVDYKYESGGTFDYNEHNQSLNIRYSLDRRYNFYFLYSTNKQTLEKGVPTRALDSTERYRVGMDAQLPATNTIDYGWKTEYEKRIDDVHPFTREAVDLNLAARLPFFASVATISAGHEYVDYELSPIDIKETYYRVSLSARPGLYSTANLDWTHREDIGSDSVKESDYATLRYSWTRGKLGFDLMGKHTRESRDGTSRDSTVVEASLTRRF